MTWNLSRVPVTNINCHVAGAPVTRAPVTKSSTLPPLSRDPSSTAVPGAGHAGRAEGQGDRTSRCCGGGRLNRVGNRRVMGGFGTGEDAAELPSFGMSGQELGSPSVQTRPSDHSPSSAGTPPDPPVASNARSESVTSASAPSQLPQAHLTQEAALLRDGVEKMLPGVDSAVREDLISPVR